MTHYHAMIVGGLSSYVITMSAHGPDTEPGSRRVLSELLNKTHALAATSRIYDPEALAALRVMADDITNPDAMPVGRLAIHGVSAAAIVSCEGHDVPTCNERLSGFAQMAQIEWVTHRLGHDDCDCDDQSDPEPEPPTGMYI